MDSGQFEIERVVLRQVRVPLREPFRISNGSVQEKESTIVELYSEGFVGYGEASPMGGSFYSSETPESTWQALAKDLAPDILTRTIENPAAYAELLNDYKNDPSSPDNKSAREPFARAGIEGAVWHLAAARLKTNIRAMIAPNHNDGPGLQSGLALGIFDTTAELIERIEHFLQQGYQRTKIKIQPGWDEEPLAAVREKFGEIPLMVDANGAYNLRDHASLLASLDRFGLMMIEQPFAARDVQDLAELRSQMHTPICIDESADDLDSLREAIALGAASIVNIKVQRVGGLWNARRMHDLVERSGLECWLGTMPELGIATAQSLAIAGLPAFHYPTDVEASDRWFIDDIIEPGITLQPNGTLAIPDDGPMGYAVSVPKLEEYTTRTKTFER